MINIQILENLEKEAKVWSKDELEKMVNRLEKTIPQVKEFVESQGETFMLDNAVDQMYPQYDPREMNNEAQVNQFKIEIREASQLNNDLDESA